MGKDQKKASKVDMEWERRVLCGDESCIGIIGPDGRCKECGLPYEGDLPAAFHHSSSAEQSAAPVEDDLSVDDTDDLLEPDEVDVDESDPSNSDDEWEQRLLCYDESCIGVIGPDGRCKECGKPYPDK